jgi:CheY-like chemotaxis protein
MKTNNLKIFLVQNEAEALQLYRQKLGNNGYPKVVCCVDGTQLLKILPYSNLDVVISDIELEDITGREILVRLRKEREGAKVKFIICSQDMEARERWMLQADAFIDKQKHLPLLFVFLNQYNKDKEGSENRLFKRYKAHKVLQIDPNTNALDAVVDVSLSGIGFESRFSFEPGSRMRVNVKGWGEKKYKPIEGIIVWRENDNLGFRYGLKFEKSYLPV